MLSGMHDISESESHSVMSDSLGPHGLYSPWNSPGKNTGMGSFSLLQGIFPTQGLNPGVPHCRRIIYQLSHKGSPKNTGVSGLSLLQQIFQTQELNWRVLHCRQILYHLSYQKPAWYKVSANSASLLSHLLLQLLWILHWHSINMLKWTELCLKAFPINYFNSFFLLLLLLLLNCIWNID